MEHFSLQENNNWFNQRLSDGGPVYMETHPGHLIVEPWNAASSLLMLIPALYWLFMVRKNPGPSSMLYVVIALIAIGGIGSALFHGFRASLFFLLMDVLPSAVLTLSLTVFFWIRVLKKWWHILFILPPLYGIRFLFWGKLPEQAAINLSYFLTGVGIALPLLILLFQTRFRHWFLILAGILSFALALTFRQIDHIPLSLFPMGTHFLWHSFSAIGAWFILDYLYRLIRKKPNEVQNEQFSS